MSGDTWPAERDEAHATAHMLGAVLILLAALVTVGIIGVIYHEGQTWTTTTSSLTASTATSTHSSQPTQQQPATVALPASAPRTSQPYELADTAIWTLGILATVACVASMRVDERRKREGEK